MLLPARTAVLNHLYKVKSADIREIMQALQKDYGNERQFTYELYLEHAMALEANGLINLDNYELRDDDTLSLRYSISEDGKSTVEKYIPAKYRM